LPENSRTLAQRIWTGDAAVPRAGRALLAPLAAFFGAGVSLRNSLYDSGLLRSYEAPVPVLSVGNISVGGTGKTPLCAYLARRLAESGERPVILMRGYGTDEVDVHRILNPDIPLVVAPDRVRGAWEAVSRHRATVILLDDGFQHRRLRRKVDVVLVPAESDARINRLLPQGPMREPLLSLRRADLVMVTRKSAGDDEVAAVRAKVSDVAPAVPVSVVRLVPAGITSLDGASRPADWLRGKRVLVVTSIANPAAFRRQISALGASGRELCFPDHHAFSRAEVDSILQHVSDCQMVVCTLKDLVKLGPLWPRSGVPLWYVSQAVELEEGGTFLDAALRSLTETRTDN
jgi:tetraacyldisaccharide 4'-kinase